MKKKQKTDHKRYLPAIAVVNYMKDKVTFEKKRQEMMGAGGKILDEIEKEGSNLRTRKTDILDKHIFPSMANLVAFFEYLANNPELRDLFEGDIKELFGYIRGNTSLEEQRKAGYNEKQNIWLRLLNSILTWNYDNDKTNFRLEMISELQQIIYYKFMNLSLVVLGQQVTNNLVQNDIGRATAWTNMLAARYLSSSQAEKDFSAIPDRVINF